MTSDAQRAEVRTQDLVAEFYEGTRYAVPSARQYHDWLNQRLGELLKPHGQVLDVGCGTGIMGEYGFAGTLTGVDISFEMARKATQRLTSVTVGSAENLPVRDASFDCAFAKSVIHHLADAEHGVAEIARALKPGGRVVFVDTAENFVSRWPRQLMKHSEHFSELHQNLSRTHYRELISTHLEIVHEEPMGFLAYSLFGFPDVLPAYRFVPAKVLIVPALVRTEGWFAKLPGIRWLGLGHIVLARKAVVDEASSLAEDGSILC